jgi:RNA polymerase sigma-70 factor (ECF subfamily)
VEPPITDADSEDIRATRSGDTAAFARLVHRYTPLVTRQMWRFTRDRIVLEELVQEVFVEVYIGLNGFKGHAPFLHWLRRIATRVGYRYWTRCERDRKRQAALEAAPPPIQPQQESGPSEAAEYVTALLARLPPKDRLVLTLMYLEECSVKEIADRTGWTQSLVKVRALRARRRLRNLLDTMEHRS